MKLFEFLLCLRNNCWWKPDHQMRYTLSSVVGNISDWFAVFSSVSSVLTVASVNPSWTMRDNSSDLQKPVGLMFAAELYHPQPLQNKRAHPAFPLCQARGSIHAEMKRHLMPLKISVLRGFKRKPSGVFGTEEWDTRRGNTSDLCSERLNSGKPQAYHSHGTFLSILLMLLMIFSDGFSVDALRLAARLILHQNTCHASSLPGFSFSSKQSLNIHFPFWAEKEVTEERGERAVVNMRNEISCQLQRRRAEEAAQLCFSCLSHWDPSTSLLLDKVSGAGKSLLRASR